LKSAPHVRAVVERFSVVARSLKIASPKVASHSKGLLVAIITAIVLFLAIMLSR